MIVIGSVAGMTGRNDKKNMGIKKQRKHNCNKVII